MSVNYIQVLRSVSGSRKTHYSQLSRKQPPLVHEKVAAYERWSITETINEF